MRKKLLMNNYSENGLLPVMDGLVCWLDGRDGKTGDTIWRDRSNNGNNAIFINNRTKFENGKLILNGDNYAELPFGKDEDINKHSFCVSFSKIETSYNGMSLSGGLGNNQRKYIDITVGNKIRIAYCERADNTNYVVSYNKLYHMVWNPEENYIRLYVNGDPINNKIPRKNNVVLSRDFLIGVNDPKYGDKNFWLKGSIASILIYDRVLTKEEIHHNYLYEYSIERG